jgi:hypothetical protein
VSVLLVAIVGVASLVLVSRRDSPPGPDDEPMSALEEDVAR